MKKIILSTLQLFSKKPTKKETKTKNFFLENETIVCEDLYFSIIKHNTYCEDSIINNIVRDFIDTIEDGSEKAKMLHSTVKITNINKPQANAQEYNPLSHEKYEIEISNRLIDQIKYTSELFAALRLKSKIIDTEFEKLVIDAFNAHFLDEISDFLSSNYPGLLNEYKGISNNIYLNSLSFLIAHEYGHHLLKHTNQSKDNSTKPFHAWEMDADKFAYFLLISTMHNEGEIHLDCFIGILCLYLATALLEINPCTEGEKHPSTSRRLNAFVEYLDKLDIEFHGRKTVYDEFFGVCNILSKTGRWSSPEWWKVNNHKIEF